jgi:hypothetical protein
VNRRSTCSVLALALLAAGCTDPTTKATGTWVGAPIEELRARWGEPSSRRDIGSDRVIWSWPGYVEKPHGWTMTCILSAYVNRMGEIYRMEHSSCPRGTASPDTAGRRVPKSTN